MKNIFIIAFTLISSIGISQGNYEWKNLTKLTLYNTQNIEFENDSVLIASLDTIDQKAICNLNKWKIGLTTLPNGPEKDITIESTYILLCEYKDGTLIPFKFFPKQMTLFDMRLSHFNYDSFPNETIKEINVAFESCLECVLNSDCDKE